MQAGSHPRPRACGRRYLMKRAGDIAYSAVPWGPKSEGLNPSVLMPPNTPLLMRKWNKNTDTGHFGEMASWQMRGVAF